MSNPHSFYQEQLELNKQASKRIFKKMGLFSVLRLSVFVLTAFGIYLTFSSWQVAVVIAIIGVTIFLFLLSKYTDLKTQRALHKRLVRINKEELKIASGDFYHRPNGNHFQNPKHFYSLDIDLFGKGSFFQFINRTTIKEGTIKLADYILANNISNITSRPEAIKALATFPKWRQLYAGTSQGVEVEHSAVSIINKIVSPLLVANLVPLTVIKKGPPEALLLFIHALLLSSHELTENPVGFLAKSQSLSESFFKYLR